MVFGILEFASGLYCSSSFKILASIIVSFLMTLTAWTPGLVLDATGDNKAVSMTAYL